MEGRAGDLAEESFGETAGGTAGDVTGGGITGTARSPGGKVRGPRWPQPGRLSAATASAAQGPTARRSERPAATLGCCLNIRSILAVMTTPSVPTPLSDGEFHAITGALLASIEATVDQWLQDDVIDIDAHRTGGLLELSLPNGSHLVLNTQPPLHELWLAARSGGFHFKYVDGRWVDREGREFLELLSQCATEQAGGTPLRFVAAG